MKIAVDCSHHRIPGGVRNFIGNLVTSLTAEEPDHDWTLYYRGRERPSDLADELAVPVRVAHAAWPHRLLSAAERWLSRPVVERWTGPIDVLHGTQFLLPIARRARTILTVQDVTYLRHPEYYGSRKLNDYGYRTLLQPALRRADLILAASNWGKRDLIELCGIAPERIWVLPHGLDPRIRRASEEEQQRVRERYQLPEEFALYPIGTIEARKNLLRTLDAFAAAFPHRDQRPLLLLTGVGSIDAATRARIAELSLESSVRFESVRYPDEVCALMSAARWGMYPSLYEGFGFPVLEALGCGLPMLVTKRTSVPEIVGRAALRVDPEDVENIAYAMGLLNEDDGLRQRLSEHGLKRATGPAFSWQRVARQTLAAYRGDREAFEAEPAESVVAV